MLSWLRDHLQQIHFNFGFVQLIFGRTPASTPTASENTPTAQLKLAVEAGPATGLADEPEPQQYDIEHPISMIGSAFEHALRANREVTLRMSTKAHMHVATRAIEFIILGYPPSDPDDKETKTWRQIKAAALDQIIATLDKHHQRATYGAVAGIIGGAAQAVMSGKPKTIQNSWVVSKKSEQPTGYSISERHSALLERERILDAPNKLRQWLTNPA